MSGLFHSAPCLLGPPMFSKRQGRPSQAENCSTAHTCTHTTILLSLSVYWTGCSLSWPLWIMLQPTWQCRYLGQKVILSMLSISLEEGLLAYTVFLFLISLAIAILFSPVASRIYIPAHCASGFPFLVIIHPSILAMLMRYGIIPSLPQTSMVTPFWLIQHAKILVLLSYLPLMFLLPNLDVWLSGSFTFICECGCHFREALLLTALAYSLSQN